MRNPATLVGWILMIAAIAGTVVLGTLPAPYVIESPGPVFDTLGDVDLAGESTPVIEVEEPLAVPADVLDGEALGRERHQRLPGSLAAAVFCATQGARVMRVHNVIETVDALRMVEAILGWRETAYELHNTRPEGND